MPYSPDELQAQRTRIEDGEQIAAMVTYLGAFGPGWRPDISREGLAALPSGTQRPFYSCKNLDLETGDCRVYETRPKMCREYPYGGRCRYVGCTYEPDVEDQPCSHSTS